MTPERWQRVKELFHAALEREPDERAVFLNEACADDPTLREEVESLIASHEQAGNFLKAPVMEGIARMFIDTRSVFLEGQRIGPYKVIHQIGQGGMGMVYLAVRADDQFQQRVAIKLIRPDMVTEDTLQRFLNERQILAGLNHPNIAKLLDGGTTEEGFPYIVMEYIEGMPIDRYCDTHKLSTFERLKLFRTVCSAVHYAHQNLVVHRDIKPSNILVTAEGIPKLLDFSIAKLLNPEFSFQAIALTAPAQRLMTLEYASPEQIRSEIITTASDVYSLGVLLYELLTGHRPYRLKNRLPHEVARAICEEEPEKPSVVISHVEEVFDTDGTSQIILTPESVSRTRDGQFEKLRRQLAGDLDNIVLMAMRKEPQRRYTTVHEFSEDIRRYLENLPVIAQKDTLIYRGKKFIKRHKMGVIIAVLLLISLSISTVIAMRQAHIAQVERAKAEQRFRDVRELANSFLFEFYNAIANLSGSTPAQELLVKRALEYLNKLAQEATNDLELQFELAKAYQKVGDIQGNPYMVNLGDTAGALEAYRKALAIGERLVDIDPTNIQAHHNLAASYERIGDMLVAAYDTARALESHHKALTIREALSVQDPASPQAQRSLADSYDRIGDVLTLTGNMAGALENYRRVLTITEGLSAKNPTNVTDRRALAISYRKIGEMLVVTGNLAGALENHRKALSIIEALSIQDPTNVQVRRDLMMSYTMLGSTLVKAGNTTEALENVQRALKIAETSSAADPINVQARRDLAVSYNKMGDILAETGDSAGALESYHKALAIIEALLITDRMNLQTRHDLSVSYNKTGDILAMTGNIVKALENYRKALEIREGLVLEDPENAQARRDLSVSYSKIGDMLAVTGDIARALENYRKALEILEALASKDPTNVQIQRDLSASHDRMGTIQAIQGDATKALESYRKALAIDQTLSVIDPMNAQAHRDLAVSYIKFGEVLATIGDTTEALENYRRALTIAKELSTADPMNVQARRDLSVSYLKLGEILEKTGDTPKALENYRKALQISEELAVADPKDIVTRHNLSMSYIRIGDLLLETGDVVGALENYQKALTIRETLATKDSMNVLARRDLAVSYFKLGNMYANLASNVTAPVDAQIEHWRKARSWHQRSFDVFLDMRNRGLLRSPDAGVLDEIALEIAKCDKALVKLQNTSTSR